MKLAGKLVVVTGAGAGIGRELVLQLLQRGALAAAVDRSAPALQETAALISAADKSRFNTFELDITDRPAVLAFPAAVEAKFGKPADGLINNAGIIQPFVKIADLDLEAADKVMDVNFYGTLYMVKAFLPGLLKRPSAHIANISSMGGFLPVPGQTIYGASKAAVKLLTEGLHSELEGTNCKVTIVFPGAIGTNIAANSGVKLEGIDPSSAKHKTLSPKDAAKQILDGMESDAFRVLVGSDASFLDKFYRLSPQRAAGFIAKQMKDLLK